MHTILNLSIVPDKTPLDESISFPWNDKTTISTAHNWIVLQHSELDIIITAKLPFYPAFDYGCPLPHGCHLSTFEMTYFISERTEVSWYSYPTSITEPSFNYLSTVYMTIRQIIFQIYDSLLFRCMVPKLSNIWNLIDRN